MNDLREMRRMAGWTQARASRASGINRCKLSQAECGEIDLDPLENKAIHHVLLRAIRERAERMDAVLTNAKADPKEARA